MSITSTAAIPNATRGFAQTLLDLVPAANAAAPQALATSLTLDGLSVAALGSLQRGPRILAELAIEKGGTPDARVIGQAQRVPAGEAARINGAAMHVLDYEPMWNPANHSLSTVLPAVLALAEMMGRTHAAAPTGKQLLSALILGIEAQQRLRMASGQLDPGGLMFHPPGAVGALGSAFACGLLLGLDSNALCHALGIAASRAGGIQGNIGSMTKALHCGQAAMAGLEAALLAQRGFSADADAIGGPRGYGRAFYGAGFSIPALTESRPLYVLDPGPAFKFFPSQYGTHFVITAALAARRALWDSKLSLDQIASIQAVRIIVPHMPYVDRPLPTTGLDGKFSFQYVAAMALIDNRVDVASFTDERRNASDVQALLTKIELRPDATREGRFDRMRVNVEIELSDGRRQEALCDGPPGIWGRPADPKLLTSKALDCLSAVYGTERAGAIVARTRDFARQDGAGVIALIDLLGAA